MKHPSDTRGAWRWDSHVPAADTEATKSTTAEAGAYPNLRFLAASFNQAPAAGALPFRLPPESAKSSCFPFPSPVFP